MLNLEPSILGWIIGAIAVYAGLVGIHGIRHFRRWNERRRQWQAWHQFQHTRAEAARINASRTTDPAV